MLFHMRDLLVQEYVLKIITPALQRLGWEERTQEPFNDKQLRRLVIQTAIYFGDTDVIEEAIQRYKSGKIPADLKGIIYGAYVSFGDENAYNEIYDK